MNLRFRKSLIYFGSIASPLGALAIGVSAEASAQSYPAIEWSYDVIVPALHQVMAVTTQQLVHHCLQARVRLEGVGGCDVRLEDGLLKTDR